MSLEYVVKPIDRWPGTRRHGTEQRHSPFGRMVSRQSGDYTYQSRERGASWSKIMSTLERELRHLSASAIVMRLDVRPDQIRVDGGVKSNVYAIAKSLEALRLVDRYEVTTAGEQYAGFKQIGSTSSTTLTAEAAARVIADVTDYRDPAGENILRHPDTAKELVRQAISRTHPDRNNGDRTRYDRVDAARSVLSSHHGVSL